MIFSAAYRWMRALARGAVGWLTVLPAIALALAVLVDRGPDGEPRVSLFPIALLAFDPFAWTCARNSLIFASLVTMFSMIGGVGLGLVLSQRRFPGRGVLRAAVVSMLAATPACLALGLVGIWGTHPPWPWPASMRGAASGSLSLDTWQGLPSWVLWIWAGLPSAMALVALGGGRRRWSASNRPGVMPPASRGRASSEPGGP